MHTYRLVEGVIENFDDDVEKCYLLFYGSVSGDDIVFKNLNRKCSVILGFEVANSVLIHLMVLSLLKVHFQKNVSSLRRNGTS